MEDEEEADEDETESDSTGKEKVRDIHCWLTCTKVAP